MKCASIRDSSTVNVSEYSVDDMNRVIDLTADEEEIHPNFPNIKAEKTGVVFVDLTMSPSPSPRKRKPEPAAKVNRITNYFPLSPTKKPKNEVIAIDESRPASPIVDMMETTMISETPVSILNTSECFYTATKSSVGSSAAKDSGAGYTTASSSSAGRPALAALNTSLTYNEGAVCAANLTPCVSFDDAMAAGRSSKGSNSSDKRHRSPPTVDLTTRSTLQKVQSSSPQYDIARKNLFCVSTEEGMDRFPRCGLKSPVYSSNLHMDTLREHESSQQETSLAVSALLATKSPPPQPRPATSGAPAATAVPAVTAMEVVDITGDVEAEVQAPKYGANIAQRLQLMQTVSHQFGTFLCNARAAQAMCSAGSAGKHAISAGSSAGAAAEGGGSATVRPVKDTARIKKRVELLEKMLFLRKFADETSLDYSLMDAAMIHARMVFRESPNSPGMMKLMREALKETKESSTRVYLLLIECKCAVLKERITGSGGDQNIGLDGFDILGLGRWDLVSNLLRRLFHLSSTEEDPQTSGAGGGISAGASSRAAALASAAVTSKSSQRKATNDKMHSVLAGDAASNMSVGASKVRTANDAKRAIAEVESADCALGLRIVSVWCAYMTHLRRTPGNEGSQVDRDKVIGVVQNMQDLIADLKEPRESPIMGASRSKSRAPETTHERDARLAADALTELSAEVVAALSALHSNGTAAGASTASDSVVCDVMALQDVLLSYDEWREEQESKRKASSVQPSQYILYVLKGLQGECESLLCAWHTLSVAESTLFFVTAQLGALVDRAVQCIVSTRTDTTTAAMEGVDDSTRGDALQSVLQALEDSTALQRLSAHVHRLCYSLLSKLRVTLHPLTYIRPMSDLLSPGPDAVAAAHSSHEAAQFGDAQDVTQDVELAGLRTAYDTLLQAVSAGLHRLNEGNRDSGVSCNSNSSAGSARGRSSADDRLLELVLELSLK